MSAEGIAIPSYTERHVKLPSAPEPEGDEVLIDVRCAGLGSWDEIVQTGGWASSLAEPFTHGAQIAGTVSGVGPSNETFSAGDEVLTHAYPAHAGGSWAKQVVVPVDAVARKPSGLSWEQAAALPVPGLAACELFYELLHVQADETLFVHRAAGLTSGLLVQLAAAHGVRVVATADGAKGSSVADFGADAVIDTRIADSSAQVREMLGEGGASAAVAVTPGGAAEALPFVVDDGRLATIADPTPPSPERGIEPRYVRVHPDGRLLGRAAQALDHGEITLAEPCAFSLTDVEQALQTVLACTGTTPVVVRVADVAV